MQRITLDSEISYVITEKELKEIRADAVKVFKDKVDYLKEHYVDACSMCTKLDCKTCDIKNFIDDLEQLKDMKGGAENG